MNFASLLDVDKNFVDVFLEAQVKHLVCLIENEGLELCEIQISSFHVVKNTTCCSNKDVNALS